MLKNDNDTGGTYDINNDTDEDGACDCTIDDCQFGTEDDCVHELFECPVDIIFDDYYGGAEEPNFQVLWASDINEDGIINILDVVVLINIVLDVI